MRTHRAARVGESGRRIVLNPCGNLDFSSEQIRGLWRRSPPHACNRGLNNKPASIIMKKLTLLTTILAALAIPAFAAETKIEGEAVCAKCNLKTATACQAAITVTGADGKKETILADNNDVSKAFHKQICQDTKKVKAEGVITEKDGKKTIALTKIVAAE